MYQYLQTRITGDSAAGQPQHINLESVKELTIGRTQDNCLQILDNTISKKHAKIVGAAANRHWIVDLESANGVLINGHRIKEKQQLEHGDCIQFGKYQCLYEYVDKLNSRNAERVAARGRSRGKINLKDYMFEQEAKMDAGESAVTEPVAKKGPRKNKPKEGKIKIPDISNYLKIDDEYLPQSNAQTELRFSHPPKEGRVKLTALSDKLDDEDKKKYELYQKEQNLFQQEQEALQKIESKKREAEEKRLKVQVEQAKISEDLIQKQLLLEQSVRREQENLERERERLQRELLAEEQQKRKAEMDKIEQLEKKEKEMMQKLQEEKEEQLQQLKKKEAEMRQQADSQYRSQYEKRKQELQMQAEALARQYQNIYRETIKKVRTEIDNEEATAQKMEERESALQRENQKLEENIEQIQQQIEKAKGEYLLLSGRNKACVLYASEIQDQIDGLGEKQQAHTGYYQGVGSQQTQLNKLKDNILNSRKLLKIKKRQYEHVYAEITAISGSLKESAYPASSDLCDYLDTIISNAKTIEQLKQEYLELVEAEKAVEDQWDVDLQENSELEDKNRLLEAEIKKNVRELDENSRDQIKKSTEQRLHMLKLMHFCPEQKKEAAKFLIEEMLVLEQEVHGLALQNEEYHRKIGAIISQTEKLKREDQYLSEILFGQDENAHHFDNMKAVINTLLTKIEEERALNDPLSCIQATREGLKLELALQAESERKKEIKEQMRKISQMGIASSKLKSDQKNPLIFFGDLLTKRQIEQETRAHTVDLLHKQIEKIQAELKALEERKKKVAETVQRFKAEQLNEARRYLQRAS